MIEEHKITTALNADAGKIQVPVGLRERILHEVEKPARAHRWMGWVGATAAAIVVTVLANTFLTAPARASSITMKPREKATLLSREIKDEETFAALPIEVDSYNGLYFRWSTDGRFLVFGRDGDLFLYDAKTKESKNLTNTPDRWELMPSWSPDGERLAFTSRPLDSREGKPSKPGAAGWVMQGCFCGSPTVIRKDGSNYQVVEEGQTTNPPSWTPDGKTLAYELNGTVHLYDLSRQLVSVIRPADYGLDAKYLGAPSWSPTRNEIAVFFSHDDRTPTREEILSKAVARPKQGYAVLDLDKEQARVVYQYEAPFAPRMPGRWSSDGSRLALLFRQELIVAEPLGLVVIDLGGQRAQTVAHKAYQADWEPGTNRLAYVDGDDERLLHILTPTDNGWEKQTIQSPESLQGFAWRPGSR